MLIARFLGLLAASVLLAVSGVMNWQFGSGLGSTEIGSMAYGIVSVGADVFKALLPFLVYAAWRDGHFVKAAAAALLFVLAVGYSFTSGIGFSAMNRTTTVDTRQLQSERLNGLRTDVKRAQGRLDTLAAHRPARTIEAELRGLKTDRRWGSSRGCTKPRGSARSFCLDVSRAEGELGVARERRQLETRVTELRQEIDTKPAVIDSDPQASIFAMLTGQTMTTIQLGLILMIVVLVELGSALGFYVSCNLRPRARKKPLPAPANDDDGDDSDVLTINESDGIDEFCHAIEREYPNRVIPYAALRSRYHSFCAKHGFTAVKRPNVRARGWAPTRIGPERILNYEIPAAQAA